MNASTPACDIDNAAKVVSPISDDAPSVVAAINARDGSYGTTCISCGLSAAKDLATAAPRGAATAPPVLVLLTDGRQTVGGTDATATDEANSIKSQGITLVTIGFGDADVALMTAWASTPSSSYAWVGLADVAAAQAVIPSIVDEACIEVSKLERPLCAPARLSLQNRPPAYAPGPLPLPAQLVLPRGRVGRGGGDGLCGHRHRRQDDAICSVVCCSPLRHVRM